VVEEPVVEDEPVVEEPVVEDEPVVEEPVVEDEPVVEEPVVEDEPVVEEPVVEDEPVVEEIVSAPAVEAPVQNTQNEIKPAAKQETNEPEWFAMVDVDGDGVEETPVVYVNGLLMYDSDFDGIPDAEYIAAPAFAPVADELDEESETVALTDEMISVTEIPGGDYSAVEFEAEEDNRTLGVCVAANGIVLELNTHYEVVGASITGNMYTLSIKAIEGSGYTGEAVVNGTIEESSDEEPVIVTVTLVCGDAEKLFGDEDPELGNATLKEDVDGLELDVTGLKIVREVGETVGTYAMTVDADALAALKEQNPGYEFVVEGGTFTIKSRTMVVTAEDVEMVYDGTPAVYSITASENGEPIEATIIYPDGEKTITDVGTITVPYRVEAEGYTAVEGDLTVTVTAKELIVDVEALLTEEEHTYDGKGFSVEQTAEVDGVNGEKVEVKIAGTTEDTEVGNPAFDIKLTITDANYVLAATEVKGLTSEKLAIVPYELTVDVEALLTEEEHTYDGKGFGFEQTAEVDGVNGEKVEVKIAGTTEDTEVGNPAFDIKLTITDANYVLAATEVKGLTSEKLAIVPYELTVDVEALLTEEEHIYDGKGFSFEQIAEVDGGDGEKVEVKIAATTEDTEVGNPAFDIKLTITDTNNVLSTGEVKGLTSEKLAIVPFELTVYAEDVLAAGYTMEKVYDGTTDAGEYTETIKVAGVEGTEEEVVINITSTVYEKASVDCDTATVTLALDENAEVNKNYVLDSESAELVLTDKEAIVIKSATVTLTAEDVLAAGYTMEKVYDGTTDAGEYTKTIKVAGVEGTEEEVVINITSTVYEKASVDCDTATVTLALDEDAEVNKNYVLDSESAELVLTDKEAIVINKRELTIDQDALKEMIEAGGWNTKIYDSRTIVLEATDKGVDDESIVAMLPTVIMNVVEGEDATKIVGMELAESYTGANVGDVTTTITFKLIEDAPQYTLGENGSVEETIEATITKRNISYEVSVSKYYGQPDSFFGIALPEEVTGEEPTGSNVIKIAIDPTGLTDEATAALKKTLYPALEMYDVSENKYLLTKVASYSDLDVAALVWVNAENADNYTVGSKATITINEYVPEGIKFGYDGTKGNDPWFMTTNAVKVSTPDHFIMKKEVVTEDENNLGDDGKWADSVEYELDETDMEVALYSQKDTSTTQEVYLRNSDKDSEYYLAIAKGIYKPEYKHDPIFYADEDGVVVTFDNPEGADGASETAFTTRSYAINLTPDEDSKVIVDGSERVKRATANNEHKLVIGTARGLKGRDILGNEVTTSEEVIGFIAGSAITYQLVDMAGNIYTVDGATEHKLEVAKFKPKALSVTFVESFDEKDKFIHLNKDGKIVISGQPNEMITIVHNYEGGSETFNAVLNENGTYTLDMNDEAIAEHFLHDGENRHLLQNLTVSYTDSANLDAESITTGNFVYDTVAFPIIEVIWSNRGKTMQVITPELGTIKEITMQGAHVAGGTTSFDEESGNYIANLTVTLDVQNLPKRSVEFVVEYADASGNIYTVTKRNTSVDAGSSINALLEPVLLNNDYFDARHTNTLRLSIFGTAYENLSVTLYNAVTGLKLSGSGSDWEVNNIGDGMTEILLHGMPQNIRLRCEIRYEDIDGAPFVCELLFDDHCDEPIITSPVFEEMMVLTGLAEPHSVVYVVYQGERYKGTVDNNGYFEVEMPMLFAGDTFEVHCVDIAYNHTSYVVDIPQKDVVETAAYPMGKLVGSPDEHSWYMATEIDPTADAQFTVPVLAGASFEIGTCTYKVSNGKLTASFDFSIDEDSLKINGVQAGTTNELPETLPAGTLAPVGFDNKVVEINLPDIDSEEAGGSSLYAIICLDCELDIDYAMETYQSVVTQHAEFEELQ